jgi:hypothetical protein
MVAPPPHALQMLAATAVQLVEALLLLLVVAEMKM